MIKNERQYRITKTRAGEFERILGELNKRAPSDNAQRLIVQAQIDSIQSQLEDLHEEIAEYEALRSGQHSVFELSDLSQLPEALIRARISAGLTQKDLADRLGLKEQQIQRYEADNYRSTSLRRIQEIAEALDLQIREEVFLPEAQVSAEKLYQRLQEVGAHRHLILERLLPQELADRIRSGQRDKKERPLVLEAAALVSKIFGWSPSSIFSSGPLTPHLEPVVLTRFKVSGRAEETYLQIYTIYAYYIANLILRAMPEGHRVDVPTDPIEVRKKLLSQYGELTLKSILSYVWEQGIAVVSLNDPGAFQGAYWRIGGRDVIVIKQQTEYPARVAFDLLHELWHAGSYPKSQDFAILESSPESDRRGLEAADDEEDAANLFAHRVLLGDEAEALAQMCVQEARGRLENLKFAVRKVAMRERVSVSYLANYMAYRLSQQDENWWGAANNLQAVGVPLELVRNTLFERLDLTRLTKAERALLLRAVSD